MILQISPHSKNVDSNSNESVSFLHGFLTMNRNRPFDRGMS